MEISVDISVIYRKMRSLLFYLCLFFPGITFSQNILSGKVISSDGHNLEYASVAYFNSGAGTISDKNGDFSIRKIIGDSIKVSSIGYIPIIIKVDSSTAFIKASLQKNYQALLPVVVKNLPSKKRKHLELGHYRRQNNWWDLFGYKEQAAVFIPNETRISGYIETIKFKLGNFKNSTYLLRIRLLTVDNITGLPDKDLLLEGNILKPASLKHFDNFSVKSKSIILPSEGVFVSFEWLSLAVDEPSQVHPPYVLGNEDAKEFFVYTNYKEMGWHQRTWKFQHNDAIGVPNISIIVAY